MLISSNYKAITTHKKYNVKQFTSFFLYIWLNVYYISRNLQSSNDYISSNNVAKFTKLWY